MKTRLFIGAGSILTMLLAAVGVWAYLASSGVGTASAGIGGLNPIIATAASSSNAVAHVSWTHVRLDPDNPSLDTLVTYTVERKLNSASPASYAFVCGTETTPKAYNVFACDDAIAATGDYDYRVTARFRSWTSGDTAATHVVTVATPSITGKPSDPSANKTPSISFSAAGAVSYQCKIDAGSFAGCTSPFATGSLADGPHTFVVHGLDGSIVGPDAGYAWHVSTAAPAFGQRPSNPSASSAPGLAFTHADYASFVCRLDTSGSYSATQCAPTGLADGLHTLDVKASSADGALTSAAIYSWTVNSAPPAYSTKPSNPSAASAPSFAFSTSGVYSSYECEIDAGVSYSAGQCAPVGLADATHTVHVRAVAADGSRTQSAPYSWKVSTGAPLIMSKPQSPSANVAPTFAFTHVDYGSFACRVDSPGAFSAGACSPSGLANGAHTLDVVAIAADASQTGAASYAWTIDGSAPSITAKPAAASANTAPSFSFGHATYTTLECRRDGAPFGSCASPKAFTALAAGGHTFDVRAKDSDGVVTSTASYPWTINTAAPGVAVTTTGGSIVPGGTYASSNASVTFSHTIYTNFQCFIDSGSLAACANPTTFASLADGAHSVAAAAFDADGVGTPNNTFAWSVKTAAPTLSASPSTSPTNSANIAFTFAEAPYVSFQCSLDGASFSTCSSVKSYVGLSGAGQTGTAHTFSVHALDSLSNATTNATYAWTVDTTSPGVTINQAPAQTDPTSSSPISFTVVFNESVTDFATGDVTVAGTAGATTATVTGSGTTYNVAVSGMTGSGTVVATIAAGVAHDAAGNANAGSTSTDNTVTYNKPPTITVTSCNTGSGHRNNVIGTSDTKAGTVTVLIYAGTTATGTPVTLPAGALTGSTAPFGWTGTTGQNQLTIGTTYTAQAQQNNGGALSNIVTCTFTAN